MNVIKLFYNPIEIEVNPSKLQQEVFQFISHQINCQFDFFTEELLSIDIAIKKLKIANEVNGPCHYLSDRSLNGSSSLKYRLLQQLSWKVIVISYFDWNKLSEDDKIKYIIIY